MSEGHVGSEARAPAGLPDGYDIVEIASPFIALIGPLGRRVPLDGIVTLGMRLDERHRNLHAIGHGGVLATLADVALGYEISLRYGRPGGAVVTAQLSLDFLAPAPLGSWIEAHVEIDRTGARLAFGACRLTVDGRPVLRAHGVFATVPGVVAPCQ